MNSLANIFGGLFILVGAIWTLQGANILPGSFMTGQIEWLIFGIIMIAVGIGLIVWKNRQGKSES